MIEIDGSHGEGGGQILRTALTLAACLAKTVHIRRIRAGRPSPGLRPQHMTAIRAIAQICGAKVDDLSVGQTDLLFAPREVTPGRYSLEVGTAGSTGLVLQTVAIPLALAPDPSIVEVIGGTHNPKAPCYEYLQRIWAPLLERIGLPIRMHMLRAGFYPRGGGAVSTHIIGGSRIDQIRPIRLLDRGDVKSRGGVAKIANQPMAIGHRLRQAALWQSGKRGIPPFEVQIELIDAHDPGGVCVLWVECERSGATFFGLSSKAKSPEGAGSDAALEMADFLDETKSGRAAVDPYAADQLMVPLALASGRSEYTTSRITEHCLTNADVIRLMTGRSVDVEGKIGEPGRIIIE